MAIHSDFVNCNFCGGRVIAVSKPGRHIGVFEIPSHIFIPTCGSCGDEITGPDLEAEILRSVHASNVLVRTYVNTLQFFDQPVEYSIAYAAALSRKKFAEFVFGDELEFRFR